MALEWLERFQRRTVKPPGYAEKTLAAYALGMKGKGAIVGVRVRTGEGCCEAARALPPGAVYDPAAAPRLPLPGCELGDRCPCVYRPAMSYEPPER
jgi:hypothetical protein